MKSVFAWILALVAGLTGCARSYTCDSCGGTAREACCTLEHSEDSVPCPRCAGDCSGR